ncbi:MAG: acetylesterase, partial [Clostridiales bacterium]|nr:acetylesterase [Clostridiales bacterium]
MKYELLHLKQFFPKLGTQSGDPLVKVYLPDNLTEMGRDDEQHPCLIVCPGGAYEFCSQREAEPIAFHFLPEGFNVFVLLYSVAPHHYPAQQCEAAALI